MAAEYEYHACFDGVLLCDYSGDFSIRTLAPTLTVSDCVECPICHASALEMEAS